MPTIIDRLLGRGRNRTRERDEMQLRAESGTTSSTTDPTPFDELSDNELDVLLASASKRLAEREAFSGLEAVPTVHLSDEQLDERIARADERVARLRERHELNDTPTSTEEQRVVARHLEALRYLIDNPDESLTPSWRLATDSSVPVTDSRISK